ncbi:sensor histidine kinase [Maribacter polysaccharolyticus]|uniref:sensor histidine kinase n=1 Tax=Maribacter polysaccharolyticus TaxID=3020831 RepID=UPI00237F9687|nr:HAMP domain-containing sensor histidine kinase [Maribacter polysaccharolyticus]MDE3743471.1 HAMP domain-containing sensor histidine kinase [Maribacter polysaccharolyticus]
MNLFKKTINQYLIFLVLFLPIMIALDYLLVNHLVYREIDELLLDERKRIDYGLQKDGAVLSSYYLYRIEPIAADNFRPEEFRDTLFFEPYANGNIPYRTYTFRSSVDSQPVEITLKHVLLDINGLIWWILASNGVILLLLYGGLYYIDRNIYQWAWSPFFENLAKLEKYNVAQKEPIRLKKTKTSEFETLNKVIETLIDQIKNDFKNLKEFNENISHEIQTPLATIRNKVVLLLGSDNLDPKEIQNVNTIYQETNKLSKIGKSLILISRIENLEFKRLERIDVRDIIENILGNMEEIINFKHLEVSKDLDTVTLECDHILADILFTNLIKNAVQHNKEGGTISMVLDNDIFEITNTGEVSDIPTEKLFSRFQKGTSQKDSLGLGLAINQKICEIYGFRLDYVRTGGIHTFSLFFNP